MAAVKLLIADPNASFVRKLTTYLHPRSEIEVVDCCKSGDAVLHRLSGNAPDAVLTELILDGMDGLAMMSKAHGYLGHVSFIVCTDFFNPICIRRARDLGASAFLCKPVTGLAVLETICESVRLRGDAFAPDPLPAREERAENIVRQLLSRFGVPAHMEGYGLICQAVRSALDKPILLQSMTKEFYPELARANHSTPHRVERNIRSVVNRIFERGGFGDRERKPTNREFIAMLMEDLDHALQII